MDSSVFVTPHFCLFITVYNTTGKAAEKLWSLHIKQIMLVLCIIALKLIFSEINMVYKILTLSLEVTCEQSIPRI